MLTACIQNFKALIAEAEKMFYSIESDNEQTRNAGTRRTAKAMNE
jgi:hypothetical protein